MYLHGQPKDEGAETGLLALHLIELAIAAGWKPRECIEFVRDAHKFRMSTLPEAATKRKVPGELTKEISEPRSSEGPTGEERVPHLPNCPEWGPDRETRRNALQLLADQNRTMHEAAEILGVSQGAVASAAFKLKISFHGRHRRSSRPAAPKDPESRTKPTNGSPADALVNGAAVAKRLVDGAVDCRMNRRCPSCNQIFEPAEVTHYLCDDCENSSYAALSQRASASATGGYADTKHSSHAPKRLQKADTGVS
jgi:hypothetical protein